MIAWSAFTHQGNAYDLSHLHPFSMDVRQPAKGNKPERVYPVHVAFSLHCFTYGDTSSQPQTPDLAYSDSRETRWFSFDRYALSKRLPDIIKSIGSKKCFHTGKGNYFVVELIDDTTGQKIEYEVYFTVSKAGKKQGLNLYVQSAYVRDAAHSALPEETSSSHRVYYHRA